MVAADLLAISRRWRRYELPADLSRRAWGGRYRGQAQIWAAFRFRGEDSEIDLEAHHAEFSRFKWTDPVTLLAEIVDFKRDVYTDVLAEFRPFLAGDP